MVFEVEIEDGKKRKNNQDNKIGVDKDEVSGEVVNQATQMLRVSNVATIVTMQRVVTRIIVTIMVTIVIAKDC